MISASKEITWLPWLLQEAGLQVNIDVPLHLGNQAAVPWTNSERHQSKRSKHSNVRVLYIREHIKSSQIRVSYVASEEIDADILAKPFVPT